MGENGDSVLKVVQLFIDNINESTKSTSKELDKLSVQVVSVKDKINTPPRHEELSSQIQEVKDKTGAIITSLTTINGSIKTMITTVRVAAGVLALAVLFAGGIIQYGKYVENKKIIRIEQKVDQHLLDKAKERQDGITSGTDGEN
jgi:hypothetical protein